MGFKFALLLSALLTCTLSGRPSLSKFPGQSKFKNLYGTLDGNIRVGDAGEPLIVTEYLKENKIQEAQAAAEVDPTLFAGIKSYSGYFNIDEAADTNIFFWFFPSRSNYAEDPVLLWLQGGPGSTSMFGLFQINGPIVLVEDNKLEIRNQSWFESNSILYIDQPAGTGFSFTNEEIVTNQTQIGAELYIALQQFFQLFPELQSNDFFITGESYAGKFIPAISYTILKNNPYAELKINLKGLAIGNGWSSPIHQLRYSDYFLQLGLIDSNVRDEMLDLEEKAIVAINKGNFTEANIFMDAVIGGGISKFTTATDYSNIYNYLIEEYDSKPDVWLENFLQREDVRRAIHVGNTPFSNGNDVFDSLRDDNPQSVAPWVEELLENYRVLLFSGQLDLIVPYPSTVDYIKSLNFSGAVDYKKASRSTWFVGNRIAGYSKSAGNLTEILVRNAGHMVPADQPEWGLDMINRFVKNQPFTN